MRFFIKRNDFYAALCRTLGAMAVVMFTIVPVSAQEKPGDSALTARSVLERLEGPALELLKPSLRLDMLDYWDVDSVYRVKNALGVESWLEALTPGYVRLHITPVSLLEIKMLPARKGTVAMTIYTVGGEGQAPDSRVEFYDAATMRQLDSSAFINEPVLKAFFDIPKGAPVTMAQISELIPFTTVEYTASPDSDDLTARLTVGDYLSIDSRETVGKYLRDGVKAPWKGSYKF